MAFPIIEEGGGGAALSSRLACVCVCVLNSKHGHGTHWTCISRRLFVVQI